ncbi:hypothetical protein [Brucella sp. NBRC 12950]|uniref:hypothetical protein n=1 Tax=Brucella sp. NBRC 12950 TaxID=2994518 RepID=UPI0024A50647|nr:hypothetical protein [Brucella sp. NBRC 12950]GLU28331.1 hypothetical protein Brsp01_35640 [Brucella sp. NBRC 12950]
MGTLADVLIVLDVMEWLADLIDIRKDDLGLALTAEHGPCRARSSAAWRLCRRGPDSWERKLLEYLCCNGHPIYSITKTLADIFRYPKLVDRSAAVEGLRAALQQRNATPCAIAQAAKAGGAWKLMQPYIGALTFTG